MPSGMWSTLGPRNRALDRDMDHHEKKVTFKGDVIISGRGPDMELGHWVAGSMGHLGHLSRPGHRVIILTRCETRVFPVFEKMPKMQNVHLKC